MKKLTSMALFPALIVGSLSAQAHEKGDWIVRVSAATIAPNEDSGRFGIPTEPATTLTGVDADPNTHPGLISKARWEH